MLDRVQVRLLPQPDHSQLVREPVLDPLYALQLRVDHERPLDRVGQDGGVLRRHVVRWQPDV